MSQWSEYRARVRGEIITVLGGACVQCGERDREILEFDHINGDADWGGRRGRNTMDCARRLLRERGADGFRAVYQLLCVRCHKRKMKHDHCRSGRRAGQEWISPQLVLPLEE